MLETSVYQPRFRQETQQLYTPRDLENLGACLLYSGSSKEYKKYIKETFRYDEGHGSLGPHINYEVWMKKVGSKKGRRLKLSNTRISLGNLNMGSRS